jgi:ubiquinone/menaquinone biosynthesis C-methylase UbiE
MTRDHVVTVAASNTDQAAAWDGDEGRFWAEHADQFDASLREYQPAFVGAAALAATDSVLDVGCGCGETSLDAARTVTSGSVLGVDLSAAMLEVARARARSAGVHNATFLQADAQVHEFAPATYDVVIGRTSVMFFGDLPAALGNLASALRPGGRLVLLVWQPLAQQEWLRCIFGALAAGRDLAPPPAEAPGPFALSEPDRVRAVLGAAGFEQPELRDLRRRMYFGATAEEATAFMGEFNAWMLRDLDAERKAGALEALATTMREHEHSEGVAFDSATWLVTATRP